MLYCRCDHEESFVNDLDPSVIGSTVTLMGETPTATYDGSLQSFNNIHSLVIFYMVVCYFFAVLVFVHIVHIDRQTDRQTDRQMIRFRDYDRYVCLSICSALSCVEMAVYTVSQKEPTLSSLITSTNVN